MLELNDPLDCQPNVLTGSDELDDVAYTAYSRSFLEIIHQKIGLICYSAVIDDPVIWSHYADAHRGLALEFEFEYENEPVRVSYPEDYERQILDPNDPDIFGDTNWALITAFTSKAKSWEYEKEYRDFVDLWACRMEGRHFFCKPRGTLRKIILGVRCDLSVSDVEYAISDQWPKSVRDTIIVDRAKVSRESFRLVVG